MLSWGVRSRCIDLFVFTLLRCLPALRARDRWRDDSAGSGQLFENAHLAIWCKAPISQLRCDWRRYAISLARCTYARTHTRTRTMLQFDACSLRRRSRICQLEAARHVHDTRGSVARGRRTRALVNSTARRCWIRLRCRLQLNARGVGQKQRTLCAIVDMQLLREAILLADHDRDRVR